MEGSLARGLAKPLDPDGDSKTPCRCPNPKLYGISRKHNDESIGLRFLEEATRNSISLAQLRARSEPATIAAVGLDSHRRARATRLFSDRLRERGTSLGDQSELAFVALELEDRLGPSADEFIRTISEAFGVELPNALGVSGLALETDPDLRSVWVKHLLESPTVFIKNRHDVVGLSVAARRGATFAGQSEPAIGPQNRDRA